VDGLWSAKSECVGLIDRAISFQDFQLMWSWATNRQTDGQTVGRTTCNLNAALCSSASRVKSRTRFVIMRSWCRLCGKRSRVSSNGEDVNVLCTNFVRSHALHWALWCPVKRLVHCRGRDELQCSKQVGLSCDLNEFLMLINAQWQTGWPVTFSDHDRLYNIQGGPKK